jgi:hypothetical protein
MWHIWGNLKQRDYLEDQAIHGRIILSCFLMKWEEVLNCICLSQAMGQQWAFVNVIMFLV